MSENPEDWRRMAAWLDTHRPVFRDGTYRKLKMLQCVMAGGAFSCPDYEKAVGHLAEEGRRMAKTIRPAELLMASLVRLVESDSSRHRS